MALPLALLAGFAVRLAGRATDDMYITYRYAQNFAAGRGLVFNPGERIFGVTDPGVALLLGIAHRATGLPIHLLGTWLHALAIATITALLIVEASRRDRRIEAVGAGVLLATSAVLWAAQGSGPPVALALLLLAAYVQRRHAVPAGLLAGAAVLCRPDALVGAAILGLLTLFGRDGSEGERSPREERWKSALAYSLTAALVIGAGALAARAWFGTLIPNTLAAKRAYAALDPERWQSGLAFWSRGLELLFSSAGRFAFGLVALGALGLPFLVRAGGRPGFLLVAYGTALAVLYPLLGVPFFVWYAAPPLAALLAAAPFAVGAAARTIAGKTHPGVAVSPARLSSAVLVSALLALPLAGSVLGDQRYARNPGEGDWRFPAYRQAGAWLAAHSGPEEDVAYEEIGILAYTADRPVQDLVGLVTPRSLPFAHDRLGAFLAKPTTFVLFHTYNPRGGTRPIVDRPWFPKAYREVARFISKDGRYLAIYRRIPGASVPPPRPPRPPRPSRQTSVR